MRFDWHSDKYIHWELKIRLQMEKYLKMVSKVASPISVIVSITITSKILENE